MGSPSSPWRFELAVLVFGALLGCGGASPTPDDGAAEAGTSGAEARNRSDHADPADAPPPSSTGPSSTGPSSTSIVPSSNVPLDPTALPPPPDVAAIPPGASVSSTGLGSRVLRPGAGGPHPGPTSRVRVHYTGWTTDGRMFDSSRSRGTPADFPLNAVIAGWTEGVQLMVVGEERRLWIPAALAYGDPPRAGAPGGMLVFDVELLAIDP